jgi:hypothetical protein
MPYRQLATPHAHAQVTNAITRQKKEDIVTDLKSKLDSSSIVFAMRFKGLDVSNYAFVAVAVAVLYPVLTVGDVVDPAVG